MINSDQLKKLPFLSDPNDIFTGKIVKAFLSPDIPLFKLRNKHLKELFEYMKFPLISESTARMHVRKIAHENFKYILDVLKDKPVFIIFDESEINGVRFCISTIWLIEDPN